MKSKNRLISALVAATMMATTAPALAENEKEEDNGFALYTNETVSTQLTLNDYEEGVKNSCEYLSKFINYDTLQRDLQSLYYLINRSYLLEADEQTMIAAGYVFNTDIAHGEFENFFRAYNLINVIADYNQSVIRKTNNIDDLIDVSKLCYGEDDINLVHKMHVNYFNAYKNMQANDGIIEDPDYQMIFKQLTTLNAEEKAGNADELSVGARWIAQNSIGGGVMQLLRDHMQEKHPRSELDLYFDRNELNQGQWILREDLSLDLNCLKSELEVEVFEFGQLWHFVYDTVNDDIMKSFEIDCQKSK